MTRDDAIGVLRVLTAAWPSANLSDDSVELWIEFLDSIGANQGREVAGALVLSEPWMPSIARFREEVVARRRRESEAFRQLPPGDYTPPPAACERIAEIRGALRASTP